MNHTEIGTRMRKIRQQVDLINTDIDDRRDQQEITNRLFEIAELSTRLAGSILTDLVAGGGGPGAVQVGDRFRWKDDATITADPGSKFDIMRKIPEGALYGGMFELRHDGNTSGLPSGVASTKEILAQAERLEN